VSSRSPKQGFNFRYLLAVLLAMQCLLWSGSTLGPAISGVGFDDTAAKRAVLQDGTSGSALRAAAELDDQDAIPTDRKTADIAITRVAALDGARDIATSPSGSRARGPPAKA
jgi:hypothetical protein